MKLQTADDLVTYFGQKAPDGACELKTMLPGAKKTARAMDIFGRQAIDVLTIIEIEGLPPSWC